MAPSSQVLKAFIGFGLLACLFTWICWLPLAFIPGATASPLRYLHLIGSLGPALAGIICTGLCGGRPALRQLRQRLLLWRVPWPWHAAVWFGPFLLLAIAEIAAFGWAAGDPRSWFTRSAEYPALPLPAYWLATLVFYGFGEEIGWRGFALPLLQTRLHPVLATLLVSGLWALWHWPLFLFSPGLSTLDAPGVVGWLFSLATGAFLLTTIVNRTGGSLLLAAGFHATMDIAFLGPAPVMMIVGALTTLLGALAVVDCLRRGNHPLKKVTILTRD